LVVRVLTGIGGIFLIQWGIAQVELGIATLIKDTTPIFIMIFSCILLGEPITTCAGLALVISLGGPVLVIEPWHLEFKGHEAMLGDWDWESRL